jgi:16S rRNA (guanine966-N2)-methyltransferase
MQGGGRPLRKGRKRPAPGKIEETPRKATIRRDSPPRKGIPRTTRQWLMRCGPKRGGRLRIIGGRFRGRSIPVPEQPGVRPTADRVRETLFNWLQPVIAGSSCLDLFAGSGALGFEAASRGAAEVLMIERSESVARLLQANARALGASQVQVRRADAMRWLTGTAMPFDVVFLDPPFDKGLLSPSCALLSRRGWLAPGALLYLEAPQNEGIPSLPEGWVLIREKRAGRVRFALAAV